MECGKATFALKRPSNKGKHIGVFNVCTMNILGKVAFTRPPILISII